MKIYQTAERETIRSIAEKHAVPERALAALAGLTPRSLVPPGVSLLLPFGARGGAPAGCLYPDMSEERAEILVLGEASGRRCDPRTTMVSGLTLFHSGTLTRRGIPGLGRAPAGVASVCLPSGVRSECPPPAVLADALAAAELVNRYLASLDSETRAMFVRRYFSMDELGLLAADFGMTKNAVSTRLTRARQGLKRYLEKEGVLV